MTRKLSIVILLCICSLCGTAQLCNNADSTILRSYPSANDTNTYMIKVRLWSPPFMDCGYAGCSPEPKLCRVISSSDPVLAGKIISILFTENVSGPNNQVYSIVMQPIDKERLRNYSGTWKQDSCIKKIYWARMVVRDKLPLNEPFFSCWMVPSIQDDYSIKSKL